MIDLSKVRNFYVACGYTDLRLGIDGLAAVVTQQFGGHLDEESLFPVPLLWPPDGPDQGAVLVRRRVYPAVQAALQRTIPVAPVGSGTEIAGPPELPLAHGRSADRAENRHPQGKAERLILRKIE